MLGKENIYLVLYLVVSMTHTETRAEKISASVSSALQTITNVMSNAGVDVKPASDQLSDLLSKQAHTQEAKTISSSIETVGKKITSFSSSNNMVATMGAITILSGVASVIEMTGPLAKFACVLFSMVFGHIGGNKDMGSLVRTAIDEALGQYDESEIKAETKGLERVFRISQAYMNAGTGKGRLYVPQGHELGALMMNVPMNLAVNFLGKLQSKIMEAARKKDMTQGKRAILYTNLYVRLAVLRSITFMQMQTLVKATGASDFTAMAIKRVIALEEENDKNFIKFLTNPSPDMAYMFTQLFPSEQPLLKEYLGNFGFHFPNYAHLTQGRHAFRNIKDPNVFMTMGSDSDGTFYGDLLSESGKFTFERIRNNDEDGLFKIRSVKWPEWYVYMANEADAALKGWQGDPRAQGHWKIVKYGGYYLLSCLEWPDYFVSMIEVSNPHFDDSGGRDFPRIVGVKGLAMDNGVHWQIVNV